MAAPPPGGSPGSAERLLALSASQARLPALEAFAAAALARSRAAAHESLGRAARSCARRTSRRT
jgi:hypothetical protein